MGVVGDDTHTICVCKWAPSGEITSWNAMASTALSVLLFIHSFEFSLFAYASVEIWPSLLLVLPRTFSNHESRAKKSERGTHIWVKRCCNWNLIQRPTCAPLRVAFYMPCSACYTIYASHNITWCWCVNAYNTHKCTCQQPHNIFVHIHDIFENHIIWYDTERYSNEIIFIQFNNTKKKKMIRPFGTIHSFILCHSI